MRIKKGFTLSEILIVLMIIGFIAALTVPSLMKTINEAQIKTAYKKAFNTISNLYAMEKIAGQTPITGEDQNVLKLSYSMASNLSIRGFADAGYTDITGTDHAFVNNLSYCASFTLPQGEQTIGEPTKSDDGDQSGGCLKYSNTIGNWIVTEDNLAYSVIAGANFEGGVATRCKSKNQINGAATPGAGAALSCAIIVVDTNGLNKGPNALDSQNVPGTALVEGTNMETLVGDWYYIYVGIDGVTPGSKVGTMEGRILSDLK